MAKLELGRCPTIVFRRRRYSKKRYGQQRGLHKEKGLCWVSQNDSKEAWFDG